MAIFKRLTKDEIKKDYDHYALMYGIVPVYAGDIGGETRICVRNWIPDFTLDICDSIFHACCYIMEFINPEYEPMFFLRVGGEIL